MCRRRFSADVLAGRDAPVQLLLDARRSNTALLVQGYAAEHRRRVRAGPASRHAAPLVLLTRDWFNPTLESSGSSCPAWWPCCR